MNLEYELEWSKNPNLRLDAVSMNIVTHQKKLQQKYDHLEKIFLTHLIDLTRFLLEHESMRLGHSEETAVEFATQHAETRLKEDMIQTGRTYRESGEENYEHNVLEKISQTKVIQLDKTCTAYRKELAKLEYSRPHLTSALTKYVALTTIFLPVLN